MRITMFCFAWGLSSWLGAWAMDLSGIPDVQDLEDARQTFEERFKRVVTTTACLHPDGMPGEIFPNEDDSLTNVLAQLEAARSYGSVQCGSQVRDSRMLVTAASNFLLRSSVKSKIGTGFPEGKTFLEIKRTGEYDVALRGLVRLLFEYGDFLIQQGRRDVYDHVLTHLLQLHGGPRPSDNCIYYVDCIWDAEVGKVKIPETENHILMTQTSRYLINQLLHKRDPKAPQWNNSNNGMKTLLLERMQLILKNDFEEYNSRPYQRYSLTAIENLHDFAEDPDVKVGARLVLDYSSAKFAVSSNYLRRVVPFRRLAEKRDMSNLFDVHADQLTARFLMKSGLSQALPNKTVPIEPVTSMLWWGISKYNVPELIQDLIVNQAHRDFYQRLHHDGAEVYASTPKYLLSAGGIGTESRNVFRVEGPGGVLIHKQDDPNDHGVTLPTTLIPSSGGDDWRGFIRFEGLLGTGVNTCVAPGFACGMNPVIPPHLRDMGRLKENGTWTFVNMQNEGFYVALYKAFCRDDESSYWCDDMDLVTGDRMRFRENETFGFLEVVPTTMVKSFEDFQQRVLQNNGGRIFTASGSNVPTNKEFNVYMTIDGRRIAFRPFSDQRFEWGIVSIDDWKPDRNITKWALAEGDIINSRGKTGYVEIYNPYLDKWLILDFSDPYHPRRVLIDAPQALPVEAMVKPLRTRPGGHIDLFTVRSDGGVYSTWREDNGGWQKWFAITNSTRWISPNSAVEVLNRRSGFINLFAVGRDHGVYSTWWGEKEGWQEWTRIGDQQLAKGSQVTALLSDEPRVNLFVVGVDGGVYTTHYDFPTRKIGTEFVANVDPDERRPVGTGNKEAKPGIGPVTPERRSDNRLGRAPSVGPGRTTPDRASKDRGAVVKPSVSPPCTSEKIACWQPWKRIGNQIASPGAQVTAVRSRPGHIDLFVVGQDGKVYTTWGAKNRSWQDWFPIGTQSVSSGAQITAIASEEDRLDLFAISRDGSICTIYWDGKRWHDWLPVGNLKVPLNSQVSAIAARNYHLDLFVTGADKNVFSTFRDQPAEKWAPWFPVHRVKSRRQSHVGSLVSSDGPIDLFVVGQDGQIYSTSWQVNSSWQKWKPIGSPLGVPPIQNVTEEFRQDSKTDGPIAFPGKDSIAPLRPKQR